MSAADARWTALMAIKAPGERKTRLASQLSAEQRDALTDRMLAHVAAVLRASAAIGRLVLLAPSPPLGWDGDWIEDEGRGLNAELAEARARLPGPLLVLHPDLPLLTVKDVAALLAAARGGPAIAPDRHGQGTNAVAIPAGTRFAFHFGADSFARHGAQDPPPVVVEREGLACDVDDPADLAALASTERSI